MTADLTFTPPASLVAQAPAQRPALVYLAALAPGSRRTQRAALDTMAALLSTAALDARTLPWHQLRYQHTAAPAGSVGGVAGVAGGSEGALTEIAGHLTLGIQLSAYISGSHLVHERLIAPVPHTERAVGKEGHRMARQDVLDQITQTLGAVPGWLAGLPDPQLEHQWAMIAWVLSDSVLSARDKALVSFGAAAAAHCPY